MATNFFLMRDCANNCPYKGSDECGYCTNTEQFIRHYIFGPSDIPMTNEEREWCIDEADRCGEGSYNREELILLSDQDLCKAVFDAWHQYVTCNCM